jgi:aminopeptidase N
MTTTARILLTGLLQFAAVAAVAVGAPATSAQPADQREVLPTTVVPTHYDLSLAPDAQALTFTGVVGISIAVQQPTGDVTLNAKDLALDSAILDGNARGTVAVDPTRERVTLHFTTPIAAGPHRLQIQYHGKIGRSTLGFFAMDYQTSSGPRRTLATNFEPAEAHQLLPCWDEPAFKATFSVTVDVPRDRLAFSNMPVAQVTALSATLQRVRFATSPKMSTYLLFLGIGDFERIHQRVDGIDVGVVVARGDTGRAAYALQQATTLLHFYDDYFGIRYPLPKLDLIAAPGQIYGGSMENWGAIFYSQNHLLLDPVTSTEDDRELVFLVVAHEMSHQWFGDLVTMAWWDNLWLNEGFARWMQTYAADALHPEWQTGLAAQSIFERGRRSDALVSTHPVLQPVLNTAQALQAFDNITYDKGAAVITMLNAYVGAEKFRDGVRRYMRAHAYGNTVDTDLWSIMQQVAGKPILQIESDFTRQPGLPLVRVDPASGGMGLSEARFHADPLDNKAPTTQRWTLPLVIGAADGSSHTILLRRPVTLAEPAPLLVNAGQTGYARVLYQQAAFEALLPRVPAAKPVDQMGLLNDALALGLAGYAPASNMLAVAAHLPVDADPQVWRDAVSLLQEVDLRYGDTVQRTAFRRFARALLQPVASRVGRESRPADTPTMALLRADLFETLGDFGDADTIGWARHLAAAGSGSAADAETALTIAAGAADPAGFEKLLARAQAVADPLEKQRLFTALAGVRDPALAQRLMMLALEGAMPAGSNAAILLDLAQHHPDLAWRLVVPRLADPPAGIDTPRQWTIVTFIAGRSADPARIGEVETYAAQHVPPGSRRPFEGAESTIRQNQRIAAVVLPQIDHWIAAVPR